MTGLGTELHFPQDVTSCCSVKPTFASLKLCQVREASLLSIFLNDATIQFNTTCKMWFISLNDRLDTSQTVASLSALIWSQVSLTYFGFNIICKARRSFFLRNLASLFFWRSAPETETWLHIGLVQTALTRSIWVTTELQASHHPLSMCEGHGDAYKGKKWQKGCVYWPSILIWSMFSTVAASRAVARGWR